MMAKVWNRWIFSTLGFFSQYNNKSIYSFRWFDRRFFLLCVWVRVDLRFLRFHSITISLSQSNNLFSQWTNYFQYRIKWHIAQFWAYDSLFAKMFRFVWNKLVLTHSIRNERIHAAKKSTSSIFIRKAVFLYG